MWFIWRNLGFHVENIEGVAVWGGAPLWGAQNFDLSLSWAGSVRFGRKSHTALVTVSARSGQGLGACGAKLS